MSEIRHLNQEYITLPIFWHTDETSQFEDLGMDVLMSECRIKEISFFVINAMCPCDGDTDDEKDKYTKIFSNGTSFICQLHINEVVVKMKKYGFIQ